MQYNYEKYNTSQYIYILGQKYLYYPNNLNRDNSILISSNNLSIKTYQMKEQINALIKYIDNALTLGSLVSDKLDKYKRAMVVLKSIKYIFLGKNPNDSKEDIKITIDINNRYY